MKSFLFLEFLLVSVLALAIGIGAAAGYVPMANAVEPTVGDPLLTAYWVDPDFDPKQRAFYYVRVIEIPKPRWTAYDAKFFKVKMPDDVVMTVQDRAYTSPIWYTP